MAAGKGGLSIIDYPFAFSIAALIFPPLVQGQELSVLLSITLLGGMIGSVLTIVNPVGIATNYIYKWSTQNHALTKLTEISKFVKRVVHRNYEAAIKSPSVSYETDKLVGMFYFVIILGFALYRLKYDEAFKQILKLSTQQIDIITVVASLGLLGVVAIMVLNVIGWRSISHLRRIIIVTILFVANEFTNLSIEGERILSNTFRNDAGAITLGNIALKEANLKAIKDINELKAVVARRGELSGTLQRIQESESTFYDRYWNYFLLVNRLAKQYRTTPHDVLWWFKNTSFFGRNDFDAYLSQLQASIDSRDWHNAELQLPRILQRLDDVLQSKGSSP